MLRKIKHVFSFDPYFNNSGPGVIYRAIGFKNQRFVPSPSDCVWLVPAGNVWLVP